MAVCFKLSNTHTMKNLSYFIKIFWKACYYLRHDNLKKKTNKIPQYSGCFISTSFFVLLIMSQFDANLKLFYDSVDSNYSDIITLWILDRNCIKGSSEYISVWMDLVLEIPLWYHLLYSSLSCKETDKN